MQPYNTDITQVIKWEYNKAPNLQRIIGLKADWYAKYHNKFWEDWQTQTFDLRTATPFGLMVWCIILGVPSSLFGFYTDIRAWAYGPNRQNFIYEGSSNYPQHGLPEVIDPTNIAVDDSTMEYEIPDPNLLGGNFIGGGETTIVPIKEVRLLLRLRYAALTSDGRLQNINRMLNWIFNDGEPWDYSKKEYFYVVDDTIVPTSDTPEMTKSHHLEYRIGAGVQLSIQTMELLNSPQYGFVPTCAGCSYSVIQES